MRTKLICWCASGLLSFSSAIFAAEGVSHRVEGATLLVNVEEAGKQFGWEPKLEGNTLVLCRDKLCVPVDLGKVSHLKNGDQWFVDANILGKIMGFTTELAEKTLSLKATEQNTVSKDDRSSYHSSWPEGRGFEPGETLPDIPLIDLEGNEVRFSEFLGKRYVIYGWASW